MFTHRLLYNGLCTENRIRSQPTPTSYNKRLNNCKLINFVIRIEINRSILMPRATNFRRNSIIHFRMFLYLVTCFFRVTVLFLWYAGQKMYQRHNLFPIYSYLISELIRNCSTLWHTQQRNRDSQETCYQI